MSARPGLCGGHRVTGVPTAIAKYEVLLSRPSQLSSSAWAGVTRYEGPF